MFDADGHIIEDMREIFEHLEPPYGKGVALERGLAQGHSLWPELDGFSRQALAARLGSATEWWTSAEEWVKVLDIVGLDGTVLYPTMGLAHGRMRDVDFSVALAKAYNDWLAARYRGVDERLAFVALLPLQDPQASAEELERSVRELGALGGVLAAAGLRDSLGSPAFAPLYAKAEELDVPLVVHGAPAGVVPDQFDRFTHLHVLAHPILQILSMTAMFKAGVFDKHPRLRVGFFEAGASWVPFLVNRLDRTTSYLGYEPYEAYTTGQAPRLPSDVIREGSVFFSVEGDEPLLRQVIDAYGPRCLCFASDYPHEQGDGKSVLAELNEFRVHEDLTSREVDGILGGNAELLYGTLPGGAR